MAAVGVGVVVQETAGSKTLARAEEDISSRNQTKAGSVPLPGKQESVIFSPHTFTILFMKSSCLNSIPYSFICITPLTIGIVSRSL